MSIFNKPAIDGGRPANHQLSLHDTEISNARCTWGWDYPTFNVSIMLF